MGIMTSPELAAQGRPASGSKKVEKRRWGTSRDNGRGGSGESSHAIVVTGGSQDGADEIPVAPASVLPGWGAGWGRVDGGQHGATNIQLHDVGSLLK